MLFYVQSMCVGASAIHMMVIHEISHIICHCVMIVLYLVEVNVFCYVILKYILLYIIVIPYFIYMHCME